VADAERSAPERDCDYADLIGALGVEELDVDLLIHSLTHRSYAYENGGLPTNERLEFLGDSVLGLIVTDRLFKTYPDLSRAAGEAAGCRGQRSRPRRRSSDPGPRTVHPARPR
jgi:hypothetical protein